MKRTKAQLIEELEARDVIIQAQGEKLYEYKLHQRSLLLGKVEHINPTIEPEEPYTSKTADEAFYLLGKACSELSLIKKECTCGATNNIQ